MASTEPIAFDEDAAPRRPDPRDRPSGPPAREFPVDTRDVLFVLGLGLLSGGAGLEWGPGWAMIVAGAVLVGAVLVAVAVLPAIREKRRPPTKRGEG